MSSILPLDLADLPAVMRLVDDEGWQGYAIEDLTLIMTVSPEHCFKQVDDDGVLSGSIFALTVGRVSYLSFFLIKAGCRSYATARALGLRSILAARQRASIIVTFGNRRAITAYRRHGFIAEQWVTRHQVTLLSDGYFPASAAVAEVAPTAIAEIDRSCHRTDRTVLLSALAVYGDLRTLASHGPEGRLTGYTMVRRVGGTATIGPLVAERDDDAAGLIAVALATLPSRTAIIELTDDRLPAISPRVLAFMPTTVSVLKMHQGDPTATENGRLFYALGGHHFS